jgi:type IV pilus assembly protein PilN
MIKVNLLKDHATRPKKNLATPKVSRMGLIFIAIAILVAAGLGFWTLQVKRQIETGKVKREELRREEARLEMLKKEINKFEKLKQLRQSRIDVIEQLKANQTGPVLLLNKVIQSIPRDEVLWLTSLTQTAETIKIIGFTQHPDVIPDFMTNLMRCGIFQSVDLESMEAQKDASKFSLICISGKKPQAE